MLKGGNRGERIIIILNSGLCRLSAPGVKLSACSHPPSQKSECGAAPLEKLSIDLDLAEPGIISTASHRKAQLRLIVL